MIPFSPPRVDEHTIAAVTDVLKSGWITTGPKTALFAERINEYCGGRKSICLNSWTNAAELALRWFGVGPGDEVIVPVYTYTATANIVRHVGATPVLVDCGADYNIDPTAIAAAITERTKVVMPVDIGGFPNDYERILECLEQAPFTPDSPVQKQLGRPLLLVDAAHSLGASYHQKTVGSFGDIVGFSFHAVKNLTTAEGGALVFNLENAEEIHQWMSVMSLHGQTKSAMDKTTSGKWEYDVLEPGFKCNMTDIQAAMGLVELERYDGTLQRRRRICDLYDQGFGDSDAFELPVQQDANRESSYHLYMLRLPSASRTQRDEVIDLVHQNGVSVNVHFKPLVELTAYKDPKGKERYPMAYDRFEKEISLPVYYNLTDDQVETVIRVVKDAVKEILG
jgi:dTDP-4-amino-4,6-dideoxygalactose transaminase